MDQNSWRGIDLSNSTTTRLTNIADGFPRWNWKTAGGTRRARGEVHGRLVFEN